MDNYEKPSEWCKRKQNEALERGDQQEAYNYFLLAQEWERRGY